MKLFLLPILLMSSPIFGATLEECRSYTENFLKKNVTEVESDEVHPYRLKSAEVISSFDTGKLGLELNNSILKKWRASCIDKPDMSVPLCDNSFDVLSFMKATVAGIKKEGWDEKTKVLARTKLNEFFQYSLKEDQSVLNLLVSLAVMEEARLHGILKPERKTLAKIRKFGEDYAQKASQEQKGKVANCQEAEKLYLREKSVATKIRANFSELMKKTL